MTAILTLALIVLAVLLFDARGRLGRLETRQRQLDAELRQRPVPPPYAERVAPETAAPPPPPAIPLEAAPEPVVIAPMSADIPAPAPVPVVGKPLAAEPEPVAGMAAAPAAPAPTAMPRAEPPRPTGIAINFEELFGRKLPIWAGGITLAIAGVLIVKYAIDIGLFARIFTPGVQAICGLLFGFGLIGGAEWAHRKRDYVADPRVAQALAGAGISTLYASLLVAANAYQLISPLTAFIGLAAVTAMALALSLRHGPPTALLGLAGGLAAPALTIGITANVPMLALYMSFTIAGLVGVARAQRWPWLAVIALIGGAGWSLWLIIAGEALTVLGSLSVGMFVVLLAVAAPLFAFEGARSALLRVVSALVGAAQLGLLVALGGFAPLDWGLFALIAAAFQWLAWRDESLRIVPTIGAALSVLLLLIWPHANGGWVLTVGLALAAIHALPLLARLWRQPARVQRAVELSAIAVAAPVVALRHFIGQDDLIAWVAAAAALAALIAAALGWKVAGRRDDSRFAWLVGTGAGLLTVAALFGMPHWQVPLFTAAIASATLLLARPAGDRRLEWVAAAHAIWAMLFLPVSVPTFAELDALVHGGAAAIDAHAVLRWAAVAAMAIFFAWRAERQAVRDCSGFAAVGLAYGALAQVLPQTGLPLVAPLGVLALAGLGRWAGWARLRGAMTALLALIAAWSLLPFVVWLNGAVLSLAGIPMTFAAPELAAGEVARRLLAPALALGAGLWLLRGRMAKTAALAGAIGAAVPGLIALHCFYRAGFAAAFGSEFVGTGLAERLVWTALIAGCGAALSKRGGGLLASHAGPMLVGLAAFHIGWYSLLLHDPLWARQAVGPLPLANLLLPLFAALPLCIWLIGRMSPRVGRFADRLLQPTIMAMVALYGWASLRQAFHGSLLVEPGVGATEDILRSVLGIALAVGYLLWGIRRRRRSWRIASLVLMLAAVLKVFLFDASGLEGLLRIASFVLLGFSLIGLGWLYSRQLRAEVAPAGSDGRQVRDDEL